MKKILGLVIVFLLTMTTSFAAWQEKEAVPAKFVSIKKDVRDFTRLWLFEDNGELAYHYYRFQGGDVQVFEEGMRVFASGGMGSAGWIAPKHQVPYVDYMDRLWKELLLGKTNGKDGNPQVYRIWNQKSQEITPTLEGFQEFIYFESYSSKKYGEEYPTKAILGKQEKGWVYYPYFGNEIFGKPIEIAVSGEIKI